MSRHIHYALAFALTVALTVAVVGAGLALPNPYQSTVTCTTPGLGYSNQLTAAVTTNLDGSYHYEYTLVYAACSLGGTLSNFSVGNLQNLAFTNQGSDYMSLKPGPSTNSVLWNSGTVSTGHTVKFWYDSVYSYGLVRVTLSGGLPSDGMTLGMVPEPCSLVAMAFGLGGVLWRRRKTRG